jgi:peptidoglycan hydrolase-like protein with peptidoglycan-binding domain
MASTITRTIGLAAVSAAAAVGLMAAPAPATTPDHNIDGGTVRVLSPAPDITPQLGARPNQNLRAFEADCPRGPNTYDIGPGDTGTAVVEVQCLLNWTLSWNAYPHVIVEDGQYGPITTGAVKVFQTCANNKGAGIAVDGRVGRQTLPHLRWWGQHSYTTGELMC